MSPLDLAIPIGGIALILLVVWALGGLRDASLGDEAALVRHIALDYPDFAVGRITMGRDSRSALVFERGGRRALLLFSLGDKVGARLIEPRDLRACRITGGDLELRLADFGARRVLLRLGDGAAAEREGLRIDDWRAGAAAAAAA
jgi:hypothetical protein